MVDVFHAVAIFNIWVIWYNRNQIYFNNQIITVQQAISIVSSKVNINGNSTKAIMSPSIFELLILKQLGINGHLRKSIRIMDVIWHPLSDAILTRKGPVTRAMSKRLQED